MQESKLISTFLPTIPDFQPIIQYMREKYKLPEVNPDDDPIEEIFLDDKVIPLEDFREEIKTQVEKIEGLLPDKLSSAYANAKLFVGKPFDAPWLGQIPEEDKKGLLGFFEMAQGMGQFLIRTYGQIYSGIANMLYIYLLTGETHEMPADWVSKVIYIPASANYGEPMILAYSSQFANPEIIVQQFREEYKKRFGIHHPKVTPIMVSTAYYLQLQKLGKPKDFIVEQFIKYNKIQMPPRHTQRYYEIYRRCENRLSKRMQRCEKVLSILVEDKK